jgi:sulfur carrier protein
MKVKLRNPDRVVDVSGPKTVAGLLKELGIVPEAVLVIREATLLTRDEAVAEEDEIEVRPVLSGGSADLGSAEGGMLVSHGPRSEVRGSTP